MRLGNVCPWLEEEYEVFVVINPSRWRACATNHRVCIAFALQLAAFDGARQGGPFWQPPL